ncbi:TPA: hypothetical protein ACRTTK_003104 [Aeromonas hydrophila]
MEITMPQLLLSEDEIRASFKDLTVHDHNTKLYSDLVSHSHIEDIAAEVGKAVPDGYRLILVKSRLGNDKFEIALVQDSSESVIYYNLVLIVPYVDLKCRPATQQLVWRSPVFKHRDILANLAGQIFFNFILKRYDVIMSDRVQTGEGQFFWQRQMSEALAKNLYVYHYAFMTTSLTRVKDDEHLANIVDVLWGETDEYQESLAIISCSALPKDVVISQPKVKDLLHPKY